MWQQVMLDLFMRIARDFTHALEGLTVEDLHAQPGPASNSIAWLAWHLTRSYDRNISELMGHEQLWITEGWHARFNRSADPTETGFGHSVAQAAAFRVPESQLLLDYHRAVVERIRQYMLERLSEGDLDREVYSPTLQHTVTVHRRLVGMLSEGFQHVGQAAYLRGLRTGHGWLGR
jgi:hypothetical protein